MVIGSDVEEQLAPFDENLEAPEYCRGEVPEKEKKSFLDYYNKEKGEKFKKEDFAKAYKKYGKDWNGNSWRKDTDGIWKEFSTYNPDSKWDWYQIGGRWAGFFKLKEEAKKKYRGQRPDFSWGWDEESKKEVLKKGLVDQAYKGDIDFEGMRDEAGETAGKHYDKVKRKFGGTIPVIDITWDMLDKDEKYKGLDWEKKKKIYWEQPALKKLSELQDKDKKFTEKFGFFFDLNDFQCTRKQYVERARNGAISTYSVLKDRQWFAQGEMGWFGCSRDDMTKEEWSKRFNQMIDELPDETLMTVVDCHI